MLPVELSSQWGLEKHTWFDITSNGYFVFLNTLVILLNYREATVSELELLFVIEFLIVLFFSKGFLQWKPLKIYSLIFYGGLLLDTLGSLAGMFVLLPVYGFIYDLSRIGLQSVDSEDSF